MTASKVHLCEKSKGTDPSTGSADLVVYGKIFTSDNKGRLSLSGAQEKYSAVIDRGVFRLTKENERGTYILKPKLTGFENREFSPANENLTMQIASQVYGIQTAENAVCFTTGGEQVYVTKRYDVRGDGSRIQQEDLASLAGISRDTHGPNFKYSALDYVDSRLTTCKSTALESIHS